MNLTIPPLDDRLRYLLSQVATKHATPAGAQPDVAALRTAHEAMVTAFSPPQGRKLAYVESGQVPHAGRAIPIRVYRPHMSDLGSKPTILWIHGGGWVAGNLDTADPAAREIASMGAVVVSVDYRLAPEHPFPAGLDDCQAVLAWLHEHITGLGNDPHAIGLAGDDAGANLAAVLAQAPDQRNGALAATLLVCPVLDGRPGAERHASRSEPMLHATLTAADLAQFTALYLTGDAANPSDPRVSPLLAQQLSGLAPTIFVTVGYDPLRDEAHAYAARMRKAGCRVTVYDNLSLAHGMVDMIGLLPPANDLFRRAVYKFLRTCRDGRPMA